MWRPPAPGPPAGRAEVFAWHQEAGPHSGYLDVARGEPSLRLQHGGGWHAPAPAPPPPPPVAAAEPPAAAARTAWQRWRARWPLFLLLALLISVAVALVVLAKRGVFSGGNPGSPPPLPYYQRPRVAALAGAFNSSLHPMLLPEELAAAGAPKLSADVIVVGAGAAGLAAAGLLARNTSVLLLEARERIGGRIQSQPFAGLTAELGAQFIWGAGGGGEEELTPTSDDLISPLTAEANRIALQRVLLGTSSDGAPRRRRFRSDGAPLTAQQAAALRLWEADFAALAAGAAPNASVATVLSSAALQPRLAGGSGSLGSMAANTAALGGALAAAFGDKWGAQLSLLSASQADNHTLLPQPDNIVLGGFNRLPQSWAQPLGSRLRLSSPVAAVRHGESWAEVTLANGSRLAAQYVVLAVPLGVLRSGSIALEPPLPDETQAALGRLQVGRLEKLWLEFGEIFWEGEWCGGGEQRAPCEQLELLTPPTAAGATWRRFVSMAAYTRRPVLVALASGEGAEALERLSDEQAVASALAALRLMFPGRVPPAPVAHLLTRWGQDPWARGSHSYYGVGSSPMDRATLAEPQSGSLVLAGEAASAAHPSTVLGAWLSGREAAYRVLDAAAELPQCGSVPGVAGTCVAPPQAGSSSGGGAELLCDCQDLVSGEDADDVTDAPDGTDG